MRTFAAFLGALMLVPLLTAAPAPAAEGETEGAPEEETYSQDEILEKAKGFFGETTKGPAKAIEKVFEDQGRPNAYIAGEEASGAIGVGLRYGEGSLHQKAGGTTKVYWQGPSIGFDLGGNVSKVFTLAYHLDSADRIFQRFPGVDGANVGYLHYTRESSWVPF